MAYVLYVIGAAPIVAECSKQAGALTVGVWVCVTAIERCLSLDHFAAF